MPYYCTVPRCTSMAGKVKNVSFHQFPRDEELAKLWNEILKRGKPYTKYSKVCSLHFKPEDYTITSVGKNKGHWRTLRKDAVPTQNLPSDEPVPQQRRQPEPWLPNVSPVLNIMDPMVHQQVAQAIYMQTMLAMQAVGATNALNIDTESDESQHQEEPPNPNLSPQHTQVTLKQKNSYKCNHCTKCFKDPDVFLLHQRNHNQKALESFEKENFNINTTLTVQANPILVNLLKNNERNIEKSSQSNVLNVLDFKMDQFEHLDDLSKSDSLLNNQSVINESTTSDNVLSGTLNQSQNLLNAHEVVENVIDYKVNNENVINAADPKNERNCKEILEQSYCNDNVNVRNECMMVDHNNHNVISDYLRRDIVTGDELRDDSLISDCDSVASANLFNARVDIINGSAKVENGESVVNNFSDKVNERIHRLAILANTNYSLISDNADRANLIFGNGKIIEGVIDFKLNDRVNSDSAIDHRVKSNSDDSDGNLNESVESNKLIIDESV